MLKCDLSHMFKHTFPYIETLHQKGTKPFSIVLTLDICGKCVGAWNLRQLKARGEVINTEVGFPNPPHQFPSVVHAMIFLLLFLQTPSKGGKKFPCFFCC